VLRESLFHRLGEVVGSGASGIELGERVLAQRIFDQGWLVGPVGAEDRAEPFGLGLDSPPDGRRLSAAPILRGSAGRPWPG
jgi:hypothetical protein